jgi:hypothetical protein
MNPAEWTWKCAERLQEQRPRVDRVDLEHIAEALHREERWRALEPDNAALEWLRQGIPAEAPRAQSVSSPK